MDSAIAEALLYSFQGVSALRGPGQAIMKGKGEWDALVRSDSRWGLVGWADDSDLGELDAAAVVARKQCSRCNHTAFNHQRHPVSGLVACAIADCFCTKYEESWGVRVYRAPARR